MNKTRKYKTKKNKSRKNKFGGKNCVKKCKDKFYKLVKKSKTINKYKTFFSYLGINGAKYDELVDKEIKKVIDSKANTDDPAFKLCVKDCEKSKK